MTVCSLYLARGKGGFFYQLAFSLFFFISFLFSLFPGDALLGNSRFEPLDDYLFDMHFFCFISPFRALRRRISGGEGGGLVGGGWKGRA